MSKKKEYLDKKKRSILFEGSIVKKPKKSAKKYPKLTEKDREKVNNVIVKALEKAGYAVFLYTN